MATNKLFTIGRLCTDPELRQASGASVLNFRLAADTRTSDGNGGHITNFYRVAVWRKQAEALAPYLHKGDRVGITGDLTLNTYTDTSGVQRFSAELSATDVELLTTRAEREGRQPATMAAPPSPMAAPSAAGDDELPF